MLNPNQGPTPNPHKGASKQSWKRNARAILSDLVRHMPRVRGESDVNYAERVRADFEKEVIDDREIMVSIIEYWFTNNFRSLLAVAEPSRRAQAMEEERMLVTVRGSVAKAVEKKARIMLMDLMMPNGKRLRACTGKECTKLGSSVGRWLSLIGKSIEPTQRVGEVLSEDKLHEFYESAS